MLGMNLLRLWNYYRTPGFSLFSNRRQHGKEPLTDVSNFVDTS